MKGGLDLAIEECMLNNRGMFISVTSWIEVWMLGLGRKWLIDGQHCAPTHYHCTAANTPAILHNS